MGLALSALSFKKPHCFSLIFLTYRVVESLVDLLFLSIWQKMLGKFIDRPKDY